MDTIGTRDVITCPWCGYGYVGSHEYNNRQSVDCFYCHRRFVMERVTIYNTWREKPSPEESPWRLVKKVNFQLRKA